MGEHDVHTFGPTVVAFATACLEPVPTEAMVMWHEFSEEDKVALACGLAGMLNAAASILSLTMGDEPEALLRRFAASIQLEEEP